MEGALADKLLELEGWRTGQGQIQARVSLDNELPSEWKVERVLGAFAHLGSVPSALKDCGVRVSRACDVRVTGWRTAEHGLGRARVTSTFSRGSQHLYRSSPCGCLRERAELVSSFAGHLTWGSVLSLGESSVTVWSCRSTCCWEEVGLGIWDGVDREGGVRTFPTARVSRRFATLQACSGTWPSSASIVLGPAEDRLPLPPVPSGF